MESRQWIQRFAREGRGHLNAGERVRASAWALLAFGIAALLCELPYVLNGYRVDPLILLVPLALSLGVAGVCYGRFRYSHKKAVGHIDRFLGLKEGLVTADEHIREGRDEEIHALQLRHTEHALKQYDPSILRVRFPLRLLLVSLVFLIAASGLLMLDDSMAVKQVRAEEDAVLKFSEKLASELGQSLESMQEDADEDARELLKDPALKEMIETFEAGRDRKALMRKLSEIDRHLAQMQGALDTRADENYLTELSTYLQQSRETAALGSALSQRNYKQAAQELEKMQLGTQGNDHQRIALEKLAAQIGEAEKSMSSNPSGSRRNAQEMSRRIQNMAQERQQSGQNSSGTRESVNQTIRQNSSSMQQLAARKSAQSALDRLRNQLQQGQEQMASVGRKQGMGSEGEQAGGMMAGEGADRSRRPPGMESPSEGTLEQLSGQLGEGESEKTVEAAASGTGTASRDGIEKASVGYQQQMEAFVRREDIPEEMKYGVKTYFEQIHKLSDEGQVTSDR